MSRRERQRKSTSYPSMGIDLRWIDAVGGAEVAHERFELGARQRRFVVDGGDDASKRGATAARRTGVDGRPEAREVEQAQLQRALDRPLQRAAREHAG